MAESSYWYVIIDSFDDVYKHRGTLAEVVRWFYSKGYSGPATVCVAEHYVPPGIQT